MEFVKYFWLINVTFIFASKRYVAYEINYIDYYKMPPLVLLDDFDRCMNTAHESIYCMIDVFVAPNNSLQLWNYIKEYSSDSKHNFRHDRLQRAVCISRCQKLLASLSDEQAEQLYLNRFETVENELAFRSDIHLNSTKYREKFNVLINKCINYELKKDHNLRAYSTIEYCVSNKDKQMIDIFLILSVCLLLLLVIMSTSYDYSWKIRTNNNSNHYSSLPGHGSFMSYVLVAFSVPRNWCRLIGQPKKSTNDAEIMVFQTVRCSVQICVIAAHIGIAMQPLYNPEYTEQAYNDFTNKFLQSFSTSLQLLIAIGGYLQGQQFMRFMKTHIKPNWNAMWTAIVMRYLRLTPVYAFFIFLQTTLLPKIGDGPFWPRTAMTEVYNCQKNWWANLLYINNYVTQTEPCLLQTWFLATLFQLFILGMLVLQLVWRFPKYTNKIFGVFIAIGWTLPVLVNHFSALNVSYNYGPESLKFSFIFEDYYSKMKIPMHTNLGSFFIGLAFPFFYEQIKLKNINFQSTWFKIVWHLMTPLPLAIAAISPYLFHQEVQNPSIWMSLFSSFEKNYWSCTAAVYLIGILQQVKSVLVTIVNYPFFGPLGRLVYSVYICHWFVLRWLVGSDRTSYFLCWTKLFPLLLATFFLSNLLAIVLILCLEYPTAALINALFTKRSSQVEQPSGSPKKIKQIDKVEL